MLRVRCQMELYEIIFGQLFVLPTVFRTGAGLGKVRIVSADHLILIAMAQLSGHRFQ